MGRHAGVELPARPPQSGAPRQPGAPRQLLRQPLLALYFTHGNDISHAVSLPARAALPVAPVPVPAGIGLIGAALAALGLLRGRRALRSAA
jgi:hypothetical protein